MNVFPNVLGPLIATVSYCGFSTALRKSLWYGKSLVTENTSYTESYRTWPGPAHFCHDRGPHSAYPSQPLPQVMALCPLHFPQHRHLALVNHGLKGSSNYLPECRRWHGLSLNGLVNVVPLARLSGLDGLGRQPVVDDLLLRDGHTLEGEGRYIHVVILSCIVQVLE